MAREVQVFMRGDKTATFSYDEIVAVGYGGQGISLEARDGWVYFFPYRNMVEARIGPEGGSGGR